MVPRIKFTDRSIAALSAPGPNARAEYVDTETTGLRLRVSSSGVKTFSLLRRVKGGPMERITLGRFGDIKCEGARRKAAALGALIADGSNPAELRRASKTEPTFATLFDEYLERHAKLRKRTWKEDVQKYRDYLEQPLGRKKLSRITRADLAAIHSDITRAGHPIVANRVKDLLSSVFGRAVAWGYVDANPAAGIEDNKERSRDRWLKPGELPRVFAALEGEPNRNFRDYFMLALLTGARRHNVRAMRWADVDIKHDLVWTIPRTKNDDPLQVPLVPEAVEILQGRRAAAEKSAEYVFPATRNDSKLGYMSGERKAWLRALDRDEATQLSERIEAAGAAVELPVHAPVSRTLQVLRKVAKKAKVDTTGVRLQDIRIHDLRRTMGSWQARSGASLAIIGKGLGHNSQQATAVYARLDIDPVRESMERAASAMRDTARKPTKR
jgi:integrase